MSISKLFRRMRCFGINRSQPRTSLQVTKLEARDVPAGYLALGAGPGGLPAVSIRVDIKDALGGSAPNPLGQPSAPRSDGRTDFTSQTFFPFATSFRGGVKVATGNFDGLYGTPDQLITAAGPGGGPHVIVWNTRQNPDGGIVVTGIRDQFFAYDARFRGGVNVTAGDLDGDGRAELITGAGPGGGPHVRVWKEINGRFQIVNEFFAFDPGFRGGVNVASGQGYRTVTQTRYALNGQLPATFVEVPYVAPAQTPGSSLQIPLTGFDVPLPPGAIEAFGPNGGYLVPNGVIGNLDTNGIPVNYFTVASGSLQINGANLLNSWGNIQYRPNISPNPNNPNIGSIVLAKWTPGGKNFPGAPLQVDVEHGPFVYLGQAKTPDGSVDLVTRLTQSPGQVTFKNQLVVGAGPGGGPHVRIYDFSGTAGGGLINNGVGNEFFAFDPSFRGGVNVAINNVIQHQDPSLTPGRIDYTVNPPRFIIDTTHNSGTQVYSQYPYDTELNRRYQADVIVGMQSLGSEVRIFADFNPKTVDPFSPYSSPTPSIRTALSQLNLRPFNIDVQSGVAPNNPLGGYTGFTISGSFRRGVDNGGVYTGGVNVAVASLNFLGSEATRFYGTAAIGGGGGIAVDPSLGQLVVAANGVGGNTGNRGSRVRLFNQMAPYLPTSNEYNAYDDFQAFPADPFAQGASVAFGYGVLPEPGLTVNYVVTSGPNGLVTSNTPIQHAIVTLTDPILLP
jgi:hypothetical protein